MDTSSKGCFLVVVGVLLIVPFVVLGGIRAYYGITLNQQCTGYLKIAADANSISTAKERIDKAIAYVEKNEMTKGSTSIVWDVPENDVGEWYKNLKEAQRNLAEQPENVTEADTNTTLTKLRETLMDHVNGHDVVTQPAGLAVYPHKHFWFWIWFPAVLFALVGFILVVNGLDEF